MLPIARSCAQHSLKAVLAARVRAPRAYTTAATAAAHPTPGVARVATASPSPLHHAIPVTALGLPVTPLPPPVPTIPRAQLAPEQLRKLHALAALEPPPAGSAAEAALLDDLGDLLGLMDLVKAVELAASDAEVASLLSEGVGEVVFDAPATPVSAEPVERGRELLGYATRRVGDYYGFKVASAPRPEGKQ